jgi:CBS domain containing-hemolysin-like protein
VGGAVSTVSKKISLGLAFIYTPIAKGVIGLGNLITPDKGFQWGLFTNENELRELMDHAHDRGLVETDEHEMLQNVFELGDTLVRELMVHRIDMVWIEKDKSLRQALSLALRSGYSRIPVTGENIDNIIGIS